MSDQRRVRSLENYKAFIDTLVHRESEQMKEVHEEWAFTYDEVMCHLCQTCSKQFLFNGGRARNICRPYVGQVVVMCVLDLYQ